jgi:PilZ domain
MDTRSRQRVTVDYAVTFTGDNISGSGTMTNLTIAGGEIVSQVSAPIGAHLCLHVQTSGARKPIVVSLAAVRWKRENRFGVEFVRFESQAKQQLVDMLNQSEGSPLT